jgi:hypothetical protein
MIKKLDVMIGDAQRLQQVANDPGLPKENHPGKSLNQLRNPIGQHNGHKHNGLHLGTQHFGNDKSGGKRERQREQCCKNRENRSMDENFGVQRFIEEGRVIGKRKRARAAIHKGKHKKLDMWKNKQQANPQQHGDQKEHQSL